MANHVQVETGRRSTWRWVIAVLVVAQTLVWVNNAILNVALKTLADPVAGLGATPGELEWALSSYTLVFAAATFSGGALGDRYGPRRILRIGLSVFVVASLLAAFSTTATMLVVARAILGFGAALLTPATLSLVVRSSPAADRPRGIAIWASATGVAVAVGPIAGGALLEMYGWSAVFLLNVPIALLCLGGIAAVVPEFREGATRRLDLAGLALSFTGLFLVVYGVIRGGEWWWPVLAGVGVLAAFAIGQLRSAEPSFDVRLFRRREFAGGSLSLVLTFSALAGQLFYVVFYLQSLRELTPLQAGLAITPASVGIIIGSQLTPALVRRWGTRRVVAAGMLVAGGTYAGYVFFGTDTPLIWFEVLLLVQGLGMGWVTSPTTSAMLDALPKERSGAGSAINTVLRPVGMTLGVAVFGSILTASYRTEIEPTLTHLSVARQAAVRVSAEAARVAAPDLATEINEAFLRAMHSTALWAFALSLCGVALVVACLRDRATS
ncbi:MFS transporter [Lentzea sp. NBRC 105346]|uniref:MFS transporter n=1 Tax=Lentzea sp. NBRC 105346 TaxID=3032205 RepID=UPI0024A10131|nr:MFS transporter [Lentzea sp. NBRC 105346]GLZ35026.1 MFS transporter [Lentzea sp. NBRC 105346]